MNYYYFLSFAWGIFILVSLIGWGGVVNRILFPQYRVDWGQRAAWGIAWTIIFGGLLNVTWTISQATILIYICLGALYGIIDAWANKTLIADELNRLINAFKENSFLAIGTFIAFLLAAVQYSGSVAWYNFNPHDDYHAYFVFPHKMLQIGSLGSDPFSERRLVSALGGQSFLHTFILSLLDERSLYLIDPGCALVVMIGLMIGYCQQKQFSKSSALLIVFAFLLISRDHTNITSILIPVCLFFSLFRVFDWDKLKETNIHSNAAIVGLLAAAICALKTTLIPACIIFFTCSYFFYILGSQIKHKAIYEFCLASILLAVFILPWSISLYQSSGTLLYPIFGRGFHGSVYGGSVKLPSNEIFGELFRFSALRLKLYAILAIVYLLTVLRIRFFMVGLHKKPIVREASLSINLSNVMGVAIIGVSTGGSDIDRYSYSLLLVVFLILILVVMENIEPKMSNLNLRNRRFIGGLFLSLLLAINCNGDKMFRQYNNYVENIASGLKNVPLVTLDEREKYSKMLNSVPEGEIVLTRLDKPFLMNFKKHTIWIADYPGGASLPPGMPSFKGEEALADYLVSKSIRYVAYSYADEANFPRKSLEYRLKVKPLGFWLRNQALNTFEFQDSLQKLGQTRKRIYDDGGNFVIDLSNNKNKQ
ncbi:hypothetical protein IQ269_24240 [Tychonema sp. LEGE 07199]|uniref:hypothetical protein n=1 Tax=unclassified Tychonema TaxID=2642144 RepID=UPI001881DC5D|nr:MULTISPECIES: hypothetical protein [unclassified Tychonema]MBE9123822.1 hypothetical protein [Tychonema sp. LEGE 07199]MBE9131325.1 hypothetical protein [Tychonema sp. LEGE 07196]